MSFRRYTIDPSDTWRESACLRGHLSGGTKIEVRDVRERSTPSAVVRIWRNGAYRVTSPLLPRAKTFIGETAWSRAENLALDLNFKTRKGLAG
jgi:hypothetical protein